MCFFCKFIDGFHRDLFAPIWRKLPILTYELIPELSVQIKSNMLFCWRNFWTIPGRHATKLSFCSMWCRFRLKVGSNTSSMRLLVLMRLYWPKLRSLSAFFPINGFIADRTHLWFLLACEISSKHDRLCPGTKIYFNILI